MHIVFSSSDQRYLNSSVREGKNYSVMESYNRCVIIQILTHLKSFLYIFSEIYKFLFFLINYCVFCLSSIKVWQRNFSFFLYYFPFYNSSKFIVYATWSFHPIIILSIIPVHLMQCIIFRFLFSSFPPNMRYRLSIMVIDMNLKLNTIFGGI